MAENAATASLRARRRWGIGLLVALSLLMVLGAGVIFLLGQEAGTRWLLARVPSLSAEGVTGSLIGGRFSAERLTWRGGEKGPVLRIDQLALDNLRLTWLPRANAWAGLQLDAASAARIEWQSGPPAEAGAAAPIGDLQLPIELAIGQLTAGEIAVDALTPLRALAAKVHLGAENGRVHRIEGLALDWDRLHLGGDVSISSAAPLQLHAALTARATSGPPWQATLRADGPLLKLPLVLALQGEASPEHPAPVLNASGTVAPFAAWPIDRLDLTMKDLDLSAFVSEAPATRLAGSATVRAPGAKEPVLAEITLENPLAGRWNEARLPLRGARLVLRGRLDQRDRLDIDTFDLLLGSEREPAGRWQGRGQWLAETLKLDTRIEALRPQRLDRRAPALSAEGPVQAEIAGLPSPDPAAAPPAAAADPSARLNATLSGRFDARSAQALRLEFEGSARRDRFEIATLHLQSGASRASLGAHAERQAAAWKLASRGEWRDLDPKLWWPGTPGSAWQQGPHRLNGQWKAEATLADSALAGRQSPLAIVRALRGSAELALTDSQLAGVPLSARLSWNSQAEARIAGEIDAAGNHLELAATLGARADGSGDKAHAELRGDTLAALAPLLRLAPAGIAAWAPQRGRVGAKLDIEGAWPQIRSTGQAELHDLALADITLASAEARWQLGTGDSPFDAQLQLADLKQGEARLDRLKASLAGTRAAHRLELEASSPLRPPAWTEALLGPAGTGSEIALRAEGAWTADSASGGHLWRLQIPLLRGSARASPDTAAWLSASDLAFELRFDADGALAAASAAPGRIQVPASALRWSVARWQRAAPAPRLELKGELEPIQVAALLARLQPDFGWSGDLTVGGQFDVKADQRFDAEIVFERGKGDLSITEALGNSQSLGLSDLRFALSAHNGLWQFTQAFAGINLGEMAGAQVLRTSADRLWPAPDTPLEGVVEMHVNNLGAWGTWVPPGWRLAGRLETSASFGGRFAAPELTGTMRGSGLGVRNVLQGVALTDGEMAIALKGGVAKIERFKLRAGEGTLELSGEATLGADPQARIHAAARRFQALGRVDRRIVASGEAELLLRPESLKLDGQVTVDEGLIDFTHADAPALDDDVVVIRDARAPPPKVEPVPVWLRDSAVALKVDLGSRLRLRGRGLATTLRGELNVSTPGGRPNLVGIVRAESGTYAAYRQNLEIVRGEIAFSGPVDNPRLDILAVRPDIDVQVGVAVSGTAQNPRIRLYSDPDMADFDKLSWLVLGRASEGLGRSDTALVQRAALALLAGEGSSPADTLLNQIGLTDFSVSQNEEGSTRETVVSLGRQISRRWYLGYERSVNATTGTWQLIYRAARRFTLRAQSGEDTSLDVIWTWRW